MRKVQDKMDGVVPEVIDLTSEDVEGEEAIGDVLGSPFLDLGPCQGGPRRSPEIQLTLVWSSCWGATESAGRSTQRGEQRRVVRARGNKGEVGVTRDQCRVW